MHDQPNLLQRAGLDTRTTTTLVRPFVAVGAKTYFNERTFIKSEFALAAGTSGIRMAFCG